MSDVILGGTGDDTLSGGPGDDVISDLGGNNTIFGYAGDDIIAGAKGKDTIDGGKGSDIITGLGGNNSLSGGSGNDIITGGGIAFVNSALYVTGDTSDIDTMAGGEGADKFILGGKPDSQVESSAPVIHYDGIESDYAIITDFNSSDDVIKLGGSKYDYRLGSSPSGFPKGTGLYLEDELIAIIQGSSGLSLNGSYFQGSAG